MAAPRSRVSVLILNCRGKAMFEKTVGFIREIFQGKTFIPLHEPRFTGHEKQYLLECIDSTFVSSVGPFVDRFEEMTAAYTGSASAVVCVNGTAALHIALMQVGTGAGDEVITQPLTFIATTNAITYTGAVPLFIDIDPETLGLSPDSLREFLEEHGETRDDGFTYNRGTGRRIRACVPVHTFGHPARITEISRICREYNLALVEDAAESMGTTFRGRHTGTFGDYGTLSFNGNKIITTGGGGMVLTGDAAAGRRIKHLTTQAKVSHRWAFFHDETGYNYRMPNINAALGVAQLETLDRYVANKRGLANAYREFFRGTDFEFFNEPDEAFSNYWLNVLIMPDETERDRFLAYTNDHGIQTRPAWTLMHRLPMFRECPRGNLAHAEWLEARIVNIPSSVTP